MHMQWVVGHKALGQSDLQSLSIMETRLGCRTAHRRACGRPSTDLWSGFTSDASKPCNREGEGREGTESRKHPFSGHRKRRYGGETERRRRDIRLLLLLCRR